MRIIQSATTKLTLAYLGIIMALSLLFSAGLYRVSYDQIVEQAQAQTSALARMSLPFGFESRRADIERILDEQLRQSRSHLLLRLALLNLLTLGLGGALSYYLARRTLQPIQESLEAQGRFTADASHELRTPLTAMRTEIEVALRDKKLDLDQARELLDSNLEEIAKLEALSAGLLRLARTEHGLDPASISHLPVRELFTAATERFAGVMAERHIELTTVVGAEALTGDRDSLIELIAILLDNAIKYSPDHTAIELRSHPTSQYIELAVTDQGQGITAADLPHIFDRFYRADRSRTKSHTNGYGLGLSIAKRIVDLHHGHIAAESVEGQGSTFRIKLPMRYETKKLDI